MVQREIIIRKADKSSQLVLMDSVQYNESVMRLLDDTVTYRRIPFNLNMKCATLIRSVLRKYVPSAITEIEREVLLTYTKEPRTRQFYCLPKTHKPIEKWINGLPPFRPICGDVRSETTVTGKLIAKWITPYFKLIPTFLLNSLQLIELLETVHVPASAVILIADIENLYPSIPLREAWERVCRCTGSDTVQKRLILELLEVQLQHNYFEYQNTFFQQIKGVPMGRAWAPAVASIYLSEWEAEVLRIAAVTPILFKRYIDDIILVLRTQEEADRLIQVFQTLDTNIKLTDIQIGTTGHYLDIQLSLNDNGYFYFELYRKPSDLRVLLDYTSAHSVHVKDGVLLSQMIRISRLCSNHIVAENIIRDFTILMNRVRHVPKRTLRRVWNLFLKWRRTAGTTSEINSAVNFHLNTNQKRYARTIIPLGPNMDPTNLHSLMEDFIQSLQGPARRAIGTVCYARAHAMNLGRTLFRY